MVTTMANPPHYREWEWTTTDASDGGRIKQAEIDLSNVEESQDRLAKLLGVTGADSNTIEAAKKGLAESENPENYIRRHLAGHDFHLVFTSGHEGLQRKSDKKARNELSKLTDIESEDKQPRPEGTPSDSGTNAEAGRDEGRNKSLATSPNAADENPQAVIESAESSGHVAAAEEPAEKARVEAALAEDEEEVDEEDHTGKKTGKKIRRKKAKGTHKK